MSRVLPFPRPDASVINASLAPMTEPTVLSYLENIVLHHRNCAQSHCCRKRKSIHCADEAPLPAYNEHKAAAGEVLSIVYMPSRV